MANQLYEVSASRDAVTIDVIVNKSPVVVGQEGQDASQPQLDPAFCLAVTEAYKKHFYGFDMKNYGQAYTFPTINVRPANNGQLALDDNLNQLWRDWVRSNIETIEAAGQVQHRKYGFLARLVFAGATAFIVADQFYRIIPGGKFSPAVDLGMAIALYKIGKNMFRRSAEIKELPVYEALLFTRVYPRM